MHTYAPTSYIHTYIHSCCSGGGLGTASVVNAPEPLNAPCAGFVRGVSCGAVKEHVLEVVNHAASTHPPPPVKITYTVTGCFPVAFHRGVVSFEALADDETKTIMRCVRVCLEAQVCLSLYTCLPHTQPLPTPRKVEGLVQAIVHGLCLLLWGWLGDTGLLLVHGTQLHSCG